MVATPKLAAMHAPAAATAAWGPDDQALLDMLLLTDTAPPLAVPKDADVGMSEVFPAPQTPVEAVPAQKAGKDSPKNKMSAIERRARHREVVKRAYHRNKVSFDIRWYFWNTSVINFCHFVTGCAQGPP
jgi:hypothetical protein